jgi:uncharacterized protein YecE (DUF72 family)
MSEPADPVARVRIGISSWGGLPGFYPTSIKPAEKLAWYARFFSVVEVNVSFYRLVRAETYETWLATTPSSLMFDVKALGDLTHFRDDPPADETFAAFRASYDPLREAGRFGCVLFQFPPRFANTSRSRAYLRRVAAEMSSDLTAIEFRNHTWLAPESAEHTLNLLEELRLCYAIADEPQIPNDTVPLLPAVTNPALAYVRLHGRNASGWYRGRGDRYDYDYTDAELAAWAQIIDGLAKEAHQVHVLFNNNARGAGTHNAMTLARVLGVAPSATPETPRAQARLFEEGD